MRRGNKTYSAMATQNVLLKIHEETKESEIT